MGTLASDSPCPSVTIGGRREFREFVPGGGSGGTSHVLQRAEFRGEGAYSKLVEKSGRSRRKWEEAARSG